VLFNPLRRRVQSCVDRSFYRNKCDARNTLEVFSARLHDEVELDHLAEEFVTAVERSVQPTRCPVAVPAGSGTGRGKVKRLAR
jgi:hypothetical protein